MNLTFPEVVNDLNLERLAQAVLNGPDKWPGANSVEDEYGHIIDLVFCFFFFNFIFIFFDKYFIS